MTLDASSTKSVVPGTTTSTSGRHGSWTATLVGVAAVVAAVDVVFLLLVGEPIPPLVVGALLTGLGIGVVRRARRLGVAILGVTSLVILLGGFPMVVEHVGHPSSGVDWAHAVVAIAGRLVAVAAAVAAWRERWTGAARAVAVGSVGLLAVVGVVAVVATLSTSGDERRPDDVVLGITATEFPDRIEVPAGADLFVDNRHMFRHTFTVVGTDIAVAVPALQGVRVPIDLPPGSYEVRCDVPGHDSMTGELIVH